MKFISPISLFFLIGVFLIDVSIPLFAGAQESLDPTFGRNGQLTTEFSIYDDNAHAVTVQADGKILVAGHSENGADTDIAIARYHSNGQLDKSFNYTGQITIAVGSGNDGGLALVVQDDGKILVAGTTESGNDLDVAVIRLDSDGLLDMDFDHDGQVVLALPGSDDKAHSVLLQKDGKIILAGTSQENDTSKLFLARLNNDGSLDTHFGSKGLADIPDDSNRAALSAALQTDGHIILAGFQDTGDVSRAALFSFLKTGQADKRFGENGTTISGIENANSLFYDLAILKNNKIVAAGATVGKSYRSILLAGFTKNGAADLQFNGQGVVARDLGIDTVAYSLAVAKDGTLYLGGTGNKNQDTDFILLHYSGTGHSLEPETDIQEEEEEESTTGTLTLTPLEIREGSAPRQSYTLTDFSSYDDVARAIAVQDDGSIILAGSAGNGKDSDFALLRYSKETLSKTTQSGGLEEEGYYIATAPVDNITRNSATTGGFLRQDSGTLTVTARGVCFGITSYPSLKDFPTPETYATTETDNDGNVTTTETPIEPSPYTTEILREGCTSDGLGAGNFRSDILNLTPDTTYYVRAYAKLESSSGSTKIDIYGNELRIKTEDACFIATAAHGSIDKNQVTILRKFRDSFLKSSTPGKKLIQTYYRLSPPLAEYISESSGLQQCSRILLAPITLISYFALHPLFALQLIAFLLLTATLFQFTMQHTANRKIHAPHRTLRAQHGFTLIELLVVLVIIGILAGYVGPRLMGRPDDAKRVMAKSQISVLETAIQSYQLDNGAFPSTEQGLQALVEAPSVGKLPAKWRKGGYLQKSKVPTDPWGNDYIYLSPGSHNDFDISSYGADNESGGEDADVDINNWEIE